MQRYHHWLAPDEYPPPDTGEPWYRAMFDWVDSAQGSFFAVLVDDAARGLIWAHSWDSHSVSIGGMACSGVEPKYTQGGIRLMLERLFAMEPMQIVRAEPTERNRAARVTLLRAGFSHPEPRRYDIIQNGVPVTSMIYSITRSEWEAKANGQRPKQPKEAQFSDSVVNYGGQPVSRQFKNAAGQIQTDYFSSPAEQQAQSQARAGINAILPTLGQTDPSVARRGDELQRAFADQETTEFNRQYEPFRRGMREDFASRFGTNKSSSYLDAQTDSENNIRVPALEQIARQSVLQKQGLLDQDQARKLNQLQAYGYVLNGGQQQFLNGLGGAQQGVNQGNQLNSSNYAQQMQAYNQAKANSTALWSAGIQAAGQALQPKVSIFGGP